MYKIIKSRLEEMGTFSETDTRMIYTPNNPNLIYEVVIDHIGLLNAPSAKELKSEIDLASKMLVTLRERCGISPVVIQQANREQGNIERFKQGKSAFTQNDAKDSGNTVQDCNIMIALYNPSKDALKTYKKYNIEVLGSNFRSLMILKNRYGECDVEIGMNFFGKINTFAELPKPDEIYDYEKYTNPNWILNTETKDKIIVKVYACCPICSTILIYAEKVINATIKCGSCHQRIMVEIDDCKVKVEPLNKAKMT